MSSVALRTGPHRRVRELYKQFLALGPSMPTMPMQRYRDIVKKNFRKHHHVVPGSRDFKVALAWGRIGLREVEAVIYVHKFRAMKRNYDWENSSNSFCGGVDVEEVRGVRRRMETSMMKVRFPTDTAS